MLIKLVDYRAASYEKRASDVSNQRSGYARFQTNDNKQGAASGDVLITSGTRAERLHGGVQHNTVYQSQPTTVAVENDKLVAQTTDSQGNKTTTHVYTTSDDYRNVSVSPGVVSKLGGGMSLRSDINYYARSEVGRPIYAASYNSRVEYPQSQAVSYDDGLDRRGFFDKFKSEVSGNLGIFPTIVKYKDVAIDKGVEVFYKGYGFIYRPDNKYDSLNLAAGKGIGKFGSYFVPGVGQALFALDTASFFEKNVWQPGYFYKHPVESAVIIGGNALSFARFGGGEVKITRGRYLLSQERLGSDVRSVAKFPADSSFVTVDRSLFKIFPRFGVTRGFYKDDVYEVVGKFRQNGLVTSVVGARSGEAVVSSRGAGSFLLRNTEVRGDVLRFNVKTVGGEIGGVGNRVVTTQSGKNSEQFVDYFSTVDKGDVVYGGNVNRRGVGFFVGRKVIHDVQAEVPGGFSGEYYDNFLGIRNVQPVKPNQLDYSIEFNQLPNQVKTGSVYDVRVAQQPQVPSEARFTRNNIVDRLRSEKTYYLTSKDVDVGSVNPTARLQTLQVTQPKYSQNVMDVERTFRAGTKLSLQQGVTRDFNVQGLAAVIQTNNIKQTRVNIPALSQEYKPSQNNILKQNSLAGLKLESSQSNKGQTDYSIDLGQTPFNKLSQISFSQNKQNTNNLLKQNPLVGLRTNQETTQFTQQRSISQSRTSITPTNIPLITNPPNIPSFNFNFYFEPNKKKKKKNMYNAYKTIGYAPSFSAWIFGVRGKYKPGRLARSGFEYRPITGYTSFKTRRMQIEA